MPSYFQHSEGRRVIETTARWVLQESALRGLTIWDHIDGHSALVDLGVTSDNAGETLKPLMPNAHLHYNEHGGSRHKFASWEAWFSYCLRNRISYFFRKHHPEGGTYRCIGEWPIAVPSRPRSIAAE